MRRRRGWHGPRSRAVGLGACRAATELVEVVRRLQPDLPPPEVSPSPRGGVTLVWRSGVVAFLARVSSSRSPAYFQREGPGYLVWSGIASHADLPGKLRTALADDLIEVADA